MHFFPKSIMWVSGYDFTSYSKTFSELALFSRCYTAIAQQPYIIQRKSQKIQRKILKVSFLRLWAVKPIQKQYNGIGLHSWGPDGTFNTHIAITRHDKCRMPYVSFMSKKPKMPFLRHMPYDIPQV